MHQLDATDQKLLGLLRVDARASVVDLARQLGVSRATIQNRLRRLEKDEVILGYTVKLRPDADSFPIRALMCIGADSQKEASVITSLRGNPNVVAMHHTTGRWDLIAELRADSLASFNRIVGAIRLIDGVNATETNLLLDSYQ